MSDTLVFLLAIVFVIVVGYLFKLNIGLVAFLAAYGLAVYFGISGGELIAMWPAKLFLTILAAGLFYSFASQNGGIEKLALKIVYLFRRLPAVIPLVLFLVTTLIAASGGGPYVSTMVMAPLIIGVCHTTNLKPVLGAVALTMGSSCGSMAGVSVGGLMVKNLIEQTELAAQAGQLQQQVFQNAALFYGLAFVFFYLVFGGFRLKTGDLHRQEPFSREQKRSLLVVLVVIILYVIPSLLVPLFPDWALLALMKSKADFIFFAFAGAVVSFLLKLGTEREVFQSVSWSTLIMISGIATLVGVGQTIGVIEQISHLVANNVDSAWIPQVIAMAAGLLSYVSDGLAVVHPTLYPLVAKISTITGLNAGLLFTAISVGASTTTISPFSTGGALMLSFIINEQERNKLFLQLLLIPFAILAVLLIVISLGLLG